MIPSSRSLAFALACITLLPGCATQLPLFDSEKLDTELSRISCAPVKEVPNPCVAAFSGDSDEARGLRLLRGYIILESAARYGAARFTTYSDAPADDAFQLMGHIATAVDAIIAAESEYTAAGDPSEAFMRDVSYPVDRTVAEYRVIAVLDSASKPVLRGVTGMLALNSNIDRIKDAVKILRNVSEDALFANAYQKSIVNMVSMQTGSNPVPYDTAKGVLLSRLNDRCLDLAKLANSKEHSCGAAVKAATRPTGGAQAAPAPAAEGTLSRRPTAR